jgi:hypothetical protein
MNTRPAVRLRFIASLLTAVAMLTLGAILADAQTGSDPLASWNDGPAKQAILAFV